MISSRVLVGVVCVGMVAGAASARAADAGQPLTLRECLGLALTHNPSLQGAAAGVKGSEAGVTGAWGSILPRLGAYGYSVTQTYVSKADSQTFNFLGQKFVRQAHPSYTNPESHGMDISLSSEVLSFATWSNLRRSRKELEASNSSLIDTRETVAFTTVQHYYDLVGAEKRRDVAIEAVGNARERTTRAKAFYGVGNASRGDVSKAVRDLAQAQVDSIAAENAVSVSRARLAATLGVDPSAPLAVVTDIDDAAPQSSAGAEPVSSVIDRRADVRAMQARVAAAEAGRSAAKASILPSLTLSASNNWSANSWLLPGSINQNFQLTYAAQFSLPIFDVIGNKARIGQASANAEQAHFQLQESRQAAAADLVAARTSVEQASAQVAAARTAVSAAEDDYDFSRERFRVGAGTSLELEDAQLGLKRARLSLIDALVQAKVAEAALARAEGRSLVEGIGSTR